jgi:hypothetical protein
VNLKQVLGGEFKSFGGEDDQPMGNFAEIRSLEIVLAAHCELADAFFENTLSFRLGGCSRVLQ